MTDDKTIVRQRMVFGEPFVNPVSGRKRPAAQHEAPITRCPHDLGVPVARHSQEMVRGELISHAKPRSAEGAALRAGDWTWRFGDPIASVAYRVVLVLVGGDHLVMGDGPVSKGRDRADEGLTQRCELVLDARWDLGEDGALHDTVAGADVTDVSTGNTGGAQVPDQLRG